LGRRRRRACAEPGKATERELNAVRWARREKAAAEAISRAFVRASRGNQEQPPDHGVRIDVQDENAAIVEIDLVQPKLPAPACHGARPIERRPVERARQGLPRWTEADSSAEARRDLPGDRGCRAVAQYGKGRQREFPGSSRRDARP